MKKLGICLVLVFFFVGMSCFAQSNNDAQRIVGTWVNSSNDITFVFNANGTYSDGSENGRYFVNSGKIFFTKQAPKEYYLSSDGKVLYFRYLYNSSWIWLDKK